MEKIVSLCKRRGFIFPSSEIYGGLSSCWDYGHLGVELKRNIKNLWWKDYVISREDIVGVDSSILMSPKVWQASGHLNCFADPLVDCKSCKQRFKAGDIKQGKCPECGGELTDARQFNLMFKTFMGPVEEEGTVLYLRPETAQGIFVNFTNIQRSSRMKIPFGIAQIGKAFRNEITPGNFTFRTREFEMMEIEFFVEPAEAKKWFKYWIDERFNWYIRYGINPKKLRIRHHKKDELAHYAKSCADIEYEFPFGWSELEGIANRGDFDLKRHTEFSNSELSYFDDEKDSHYIPYVIEPSGGVDRAALAFLVDAFDEEVVKGETRIILRLSPQLSPIQIGIFPLVKRDGMPDIARKIEKDLRGDFRVFYDEGGSIGRRYRRQDEIGTPLAITVDSDTLKDNTVTIRERDSMQQSRVKIPDLKQELKVKIDKEI